MTNGRPADIESRLSRLEEAFVSAGDFLLQASALAQQNTTAIEQNTRAIEQNTRAIAQLTERIGSLTAASERHDRILDYLLGQQQTNDSQ